jgi:hypothetical protein
VETVYGYTPYHSWVEPEGPKQCWGDAFRIPGACQPPLSRDRVVPEFNMGWTVRTPSQFRDYGDNQISWAGNAGWTKGTHNVKFGFDLNRMYLNHYETQAPTFNFNGGATALSGGASPNIYNQFADFLLGLPSQRTAQGMTPLLSTDGAKSPELPATVRSASYGVYLRDQWQLSRKMTASVGMRWEYYPFPRRTDSGLQIFDFATNLMQLCGLPGANEQVCDIKVQKDLFTPRLGLAYRPTESTVIRVGFSRNPQSSNDVTRVNGLAQSFPKLIALSETGPNNFTPVGTLTEGVPLVPTLDLTRGTVSLPPGTGVTTVQDVYIRGTITSWNVTVQRLFPYSLSVQAGYVANRQKNLTQPQNLNYGQIGGGASSQPFNQPGLANGLRTTSTMNVFRPLGRVDYDSLQLSVTRRMIHGFQLTSGYTFSKSIDWWAGTIAIPEYWDRNKAVQGGDTRVGSSRPHKLDLAVVYELPFGEGKRFLKEGGIFANIVGGWQLSSMFTAYSGAPFTVTASTASLNAPGSPQLADQVKDKVEILGGVGPTTPYFDVTAFRPVTEARFGTASFNSLRGPGVRNIDLIAMRTLAVNRSMNVQLRFEVYNLMNRPTFANPIAANLNVSNLQLNPDGTVRSLNGFGVINSTQNVGREYSERYVRLGLRLAF